MPAMPNLDDFVLWNNKKANSTDNLKKINKVSYTLFTPKVGKLRVTADTTKIKQKKKGKFLRQLMILKGEKAPI